MRGNILIGVWYNYLLFCPKTNNKPPHRYLKTLKNEPKPDATEHKNPKKTEDEA